MVAVQILSAHRLCPRMLSVASLPEVVLEMQHQRREGSQLRVDHLLEGGLPVYLVFREAIMPAPAHSGFRDQHGFPTGESRAACEGQESIHRPPA